MKKAIWSIFILQLTVFTVIGTILFFQNKYIKLFYTDVSYVDVLVSKKEAFDAFLTWAEERDVIVARVSVSPDNDITLHLCEWAFSDTLTLLEGKFPGHGEYVSDIIAEDADQSGILKRVLPNYNFKIYSLYEPEQLNFSSLYAITLTSENEINEMKNQLALKGVTIQVNEVWNGNSIPILLSSFSNVQVMLVLIFLCSSTLVMFVSLIQYVIQQIKSINILLTLGYGWCKIIHSVISGVLCEKICLGSIGGLYIILSLVLLTNNIYRSFYLQIVCIFGGIFIILSCVYFLILSFVISIYLITKRNKIPLSLKGMKPHFIVQIGNCCVKFASALLFIMAITFLIALYEQFITERKNMQNWVDAQNVYKVSMNDVGQELDLAIEVELHKKITSLYQHLVQENNAFFMDADDIYAMEVYGENYPLTGLVTNGYSTHITVSPNYFNYNPIVTSENMPVEEKLIFSDNVLNLLVPESLYSIHEELNERFLEYFDFYRFEVYERVYSDTSNDLWNPSKQDELQINIIPVKNGQYYFTFSPNIRQDEYNRILDPVVVVYTDNFHPSITFTKASRCLFFQYDNIENMKANDYLAEIVGMDDFVFASSVWNKMSERVLQFQRNYIATIFLTLFIVLGYLITSFSLFSNYFIRNCYSFTIKVLWGFSIFRRYSSAFVLLFMPTLMALFLFILIKASRLARLFPAVSVQELLQIGIFLIGIDGLYFVIMEKSLRKKSMNCILKGEVS